MSQIKQLLQLHQNQKGKGIKLIAEYTTMNYEKSEIKRLLSDSLVNISNEKRQELSEKMRATIAGAPIE